MEQRRQRELGFGHIGLLLGISLACIIFTAVLTWRRHHDHPLVSDALKTALANANCTDQQDVDLCKFFAAYAAQPYTTATFSSPANTNPGTYQTDNNGGYHLTLQKQNNHYEIIGLDTLLYSKNADGTWWRVQVPRSDLDKYNSGPAVALAFPEPGPGVTYRKQDSAPCQTHTTLTCAKYRLTDASNGNPARFIWFDTTNYQLQHLKTIDVNGTVDAAIGYGKVSIKRPSPVKDLPKNKYLVPGQTEPVALPAGASWDSSAGGLIDQYQQSQ
jgi:hypothetical protein